LADIMKEKVKIGATGEVCFKVGPEHVIDFANNQMPPVLATPWLIKFLEQAGREALKPALDEGENSVGTEIQMRHLAPTPLGHTVKCIARVIRTEDHLITFQIEASDELELIARGVHQRAIIHMDRFARGVGRKGAGRSWNS
jgi:fluoroacetyl-CoA thioesterase